jgi:glycosyltransferase involved in cell wall biosynthesis
MAASGIGQVRLGVLFISSAEQPGADTFINMLVMRALDRSQFAVHLACPPSEDDSTPDPYARWIDDTVQVRRCRFGPSLTATSRPGVRAAQAVAATTSLLGLARYIRRHRIGIVHASDRPRDAAACRLLCLLTGARSVIHVHVKYDNWVGAPVRWALRHADAVIGVSRFVAETLVRGGYAPERVHAVLNAIEVERWTRGADGASVRAEFGIPADAPVMLCAARLFHWKGQGELVSAIPALRRTFPSVRLMIVGGDYQLAPGQSYLRDLKTLVRDLGVEEQVIFTGHRTDMTDLMAACDVFALPSFEEPFGLVFAEAMASQKPVIGLRTGGVPEVVDHGESGLLSPPGDREALTRNIATLLGNRELRRRMGEYGRRVVEQRFTPARLAADVEQIYNRIRRGGRREHLLVERPV